MTQLLKIKSIKEADDEQLLLEFKRTGQQEMLATLFLRYSDLLYGVCLKYLEDAEEAKDAVMNIYQELLRKVPLHEIQHFKSWVYVLTKNFCLMQLRKTKKNITVNLDQQAVQSEDFSHLDDVMDQEETFNRLEDCMNKLSGDQEKTIRMFYYENKCYNEITENTGLDWNKVRSLIQNGRRNLKNCMEKNAV
ncbi:MAG TPA: sigma-70 family RNA polymerase sigma factor [Niabella sp.]|nr:sigma-70 family RNA polymerase sigma factor [Niabella sp.]HQW15008.1 sigma-70 family RNA polymerase sigma factor [Niabella sp.]HQX20100.1 sigma-70 family RNA polymerase sigma factor [Niabella sp.]HQX40388.1 sigma-70 family RNA polymerase sigma factor [Niabella sp.]HRB06705.1 sigma-70 family RNA polymerase sigma factor [Niabella sp.]